MTAYNIPTYEVLPTFLGTSRSDRKADYVVAGICYDLATSNRPGARFGAAAMRAASRMLYDGDHPVHWTNPLRDLDLSDMGNFHLPLGRLDESLAAIEKEAADLRHLIALGGDHSMTFALLKALHKKNGPMALVHFDAHTDLWPSCFGEPMGHGAVFHRVLEAGLVDPKHMVQVGIRAKIDRGVYDWIKGQGVTIITAEEVHLSTPKAIADKIAAVIGTKPAYMSFDIDCIDPSQAPGTGSPEIGGLFTWQAVNIIRGLAGLHFKGMDVVEVAPAYDHAEITALAGATMAYEYLCLEALKQKK
jgi:agmatinase